MKTDTLVSHLSNVVPSVLCSFIFRVHSLSVPTDLLLKIIAVRLIEVVIITQLCANNVNRKRAVLPIVRRLPVTSFALLLLLPMAGPKSTGCSSVDCSVLGITVISIDWGWRLLLLSSNLIEPGWSSHHRSEHRRQHLPEIDLTLSTTLNNSRLCWLKSPNCDGIQFVSHRPFAARKHRSKFSSKMIWSDRFPSSNSLQTAQARNC